MAITQIFGASVKRREDPRLITGKGYYTDDINLPGQTYMAVLRSPYGHARIRGINTERAKTHPGVVAVFTGKDLADGGLNPVPCAWVLELGMVNGQKMAQPTFPALAADRVRYTGDGVAVVIAEDPYTAKDALDLIDIDYEPLPAVTNQEKAMQAGAPQLHDEAPNNIAFHWQLKNGDIDAAFASAEVVVKQRFINQRLIPNAMETHATVASWNAGAEEMTLWTTSQNPHVTRLLGTLVTGIPEHKLRVIARDVGGGFGSKIQFYPGDALAMWASKKLARPVKWTEERRENYLATTHGRDHVDEVEVAARKDGAILGIRVKAIANMGAYLSTAAPGVPTWLFATMLAGCYKFEALQSDTYGVYTNTVPTDAYRGAGRPEATYLVERCVDLVAHELGMDPVEIRRKNFVQPDEFPYTSIGTFVYDSGNYQASLDKALAMADYAGFRQRQAEARKQGRYLGIGLSTYVEVCGIAPSAGANAIGFGGGLWESAVVRMHPTGSVTVFTGSSPHGQGEETTFAQIVSHELGVPIEAVEILHGDTNSVPFGMGTYGSRTTAVGGAALVMAARKIREKARKIAAHLLEAAVDDVIFDNGTFSVQGSPDKKKAIQEIAFASYMAGNLPPDVTPMLEENHYYDPPNFVFPFGAHLCEVEVDADTGVTKLLRYIAVDDCGPVINPMIVDGQVHGGLAQGIGQALYEHGVYDDNGQLLSGSMMDYVVPKADELISFDLAHTVTPSPHQPLGVKGIGETGTIGSTPAVANAVVDALAPFGIAHVDIPLTPENVWRAIQHARQP
ncbi:MAG TPA: molybdopterin cofactor-binding domain-containing protein [Ktedonobacterales bacterium]|jgi:carbon-monoxide dehydrogenase large subunit